MKKSERIKNLFKSTLALIITGAACTAHAFTYADTDLLLVFRKDGTFKDVEFNLGSVSNYLGKAAGTKITVPGWDLNTVRTNFNNSLASVKFLLVAATAVSDSQRRLWLTDADLAPAGPPRDLSGSRWSLLQGKLGYVGGEAQSITVSNATQVYIVGNSDPSAYTAIASYSGQVDPTSLGGLAPFPVDAENPTTLLFYELKISNAAIKPAAALIGSFCVDSSGTLAFTAGPLAPLTKPNISIARTGNQNVISFGSLNCINYRLRFTSTLSADTAPLPLLIPGDGTGKSFTNSPAGNTGFYTVEALY